MGYFKTTLPVLISEIDLESVSDHELDDNDRDRHSDSNEDDSMQHTLVVMDGDDQKSDSEGLYSSNGTLKAKNTKMMKRKSGGHRSGTIIYANI